MEIYIPSSVLLPASDFDATQFFSRAAIFKNRLIKAFKKAFKSDHEIQGCIIVI